MQLFRDASTRPASPGVFTRPRPGPDSRLAEISPNETLWNVGTCPRSLRLDARELDHLGPFVDIFGDELGELVRRVRRYRHGAEIGEPLLDVRVEHRRVGLLVERRNDLRRRAPWNAETDPARRLVALEEAVDRRHVR